MSEKETGVVKSFNPSKGFGFIVRENGTEVFVRYTSIQSSGFRYLEEGQRVEFRVERGKEAVEVVVL